MKSLRLSFTRKVGDHGILYGSVTSMDIVEALKERGYEIDRRRITLREAIKETGEFTVPVRLHREVTVEVPVEVMAEGAAKAENVAAAPAPTPPSDETTEEATAES
jgi:large subunit ribosomal protein L9